MTDGLDISGGNIVVTTDGRKAIDTAGHYVMGLPSSAQSLTKSVTFPDFDKAYWYNWQWYAFCNGGSGSNYDYTLWNAGTLYVSALGQEWVQDTIVCPAATVADGTPLGFLGKVRLNRTKDPSHGVSGASLSMRVPANVWLPNNGSLLLENVVFGIARTLTLMVVDGNLVLRQRQSVTSSPPGEDFAAYGNAQNSTLTTGGSSLRGGWWDAMSIDTTNADGGSRGAAFRGVPLYTDPDNAMVDHTTTTTPVNQPGTLVACQTCNYYAVGTSGAKVCRFADPTDYSSTYTVDIEGEFVRLT